MRFTCGLLIHTSSSLISYAAPVLHHGKPHLRHQMPIKAEQANNRVQILPNATKLDTDVAQAAHKTQLALIFSAMDSVDAVTEEFGSDAIVFDRGSVSIYIAACLGMSAFVTAIIYPLGVVIVCQTLVYVCSLAFIKMSLKIVFSLGYNYPKFITALHLGITSIVAVSILCYRYRALGKPLAIPDRSEMLYGVLPIASAFGLSIAFENTALIFVSASFAEVIGASTPVASAYLTYVMGMPFALQLMRPIIVVVIGCLVSVQGEIHFSCIGCALLLLAVFCRSFKAVLQQKFMTSTNPDKFDPVTMTAWTCSVASAIVAAYSFAREGYEPIYAIASAPNVTALIAALFASCLVASLLNISGLFLVKGLGAVGMQIVGQVKAFLVVIGGLTLLKETFTCVQIFGFALALVGVFWYSSMHRRLAQTEKERCALPKAT